MTDTCGYDSIAIFEEFPTILIQLQIITGGEKGNPSANETTLTEAALCDAIFRTRALDRLAAGTGDRPFLCCYPACRRNELLAFVVPGWLRLRLR
jgi:hypothetical protein